MLVGFSLVKNEADIIEPFVRHNLQYLDFLVIGDNGSSDNTRSILLALQAEGLPIAVFDDPIFAYSQSQKMTRIARRLHLSLRPDFLFPLDADEFLAAGSREEMLRALSDIPERGIGLVPWVSHVISPEDASAGSIDPPRSIRFKRRFEHPQYFKVVIRGDWDGELGFIIDQGSHDVSALPGCTVERRILRDVKLAHFPVRTSDQLATKAILGWMAYLELNPDAHSFGAGYQWRDNFDRLLERGTLLSELPERSMLYAQLRSRDSINWDIDIAPTHCVWEYLRKYPALATRNPLVEVARAWERTLRSDRSTDSGVITTASVEKYERRTILDRPPFEYLINRFQLGKFVLTDQALLPSVGQPYSGFNCDIEILDFSSGCGVGDLSAPTALCLDYEYINTDEHVSIFDTVRPHVVLFYALSTEYAPETEPAKLLESLSRLPALGYALDVGSSIGFRSLAGSLVKTSALLFVDVRRYGKDWFSNSRESLRLDVIFKSINVKDEPHIYAFQS